MLSHHFHTIFVHVPKTGGQSVEAVFLRKLGLTWEQRAPLLLRPNDDPARGPPRLTHLYASEYVALGHVRRDDFDRYFKFSIVRNPWARMASEYKFNYQPLGASFLDFARDVVRDGKFVIEPRHTEPQTVFLVDGRGQVLVDEILRFERLAQDFAVVSRRIFGQSEPLPMRNVSADRTPYQSLYGDESFAIVSTRYRDDIETFGYRFDGG